MPEIKCPNCGTVFTVDKSDYAEIVDQIRNAEFEKALADRLGSALETERAKTQAQEAQMRAAHENELTRIKAELEQVRQEKESEVMRSTASLRVEIEGLKGQLQQAKSEKELAVQDEHSKALVAINELQNKLNLADTEREAALASLKLEQSTVLEAKNQEITDAKNSLLLLKSDHEIQLRAKDQEIAFYKDLKARMSTKMVGETLEEHCRIEFDRIRMTAFPRAYFEKDNDAKTGSKGDFIFKDFTDDGIPFISIMFEMKNEMETTATKHRNEDFFKELDKDRREKGCEYAVLVSMLEADSDLYNAGIVDVSYRYEKMYVVRPQCFLAIITLLRNAALKSISYMREVEEFKRQNVDMTNFEQALEDFQKAFGGQYEQAKKRFDEAIAGIDKTIDYLQKVKDNLLKSSNHLRIANDKAQDLSVKRLTKNSPLLAAKLAQMKKESEA